MNINIETLKKYLEENKAKVKIFALALIVIISFIYYKTGFDSGEIKVSGQNQSDYSVNMQENEPPETTNDEVPQTTENAAVSYHSKDAYVDISGEVIKPGVYKVTTSTRLFEVIELAGGLTENANYNSINQAEMVYDGEKIIVPHIEADKIYEVGENKSEATGSVSHRNINSADTELININTADAALLQTLPGIGPSKSRSIIEYRDVNGSFKSIEELKKVNGIGEKTFETIKDLIIS